MKYLFLILFSFLIVYSSAQQIDKRKQKNQKLKILLITEGATYTATLIGLNSLWYKNYPKSDFHFINDKKNYDANMPPITVKNDQDIAAVVSYIRQAWGNEADVVYPSEVTAVRKQYEGRKSMWRAEELLN